MTVELGLRLRFSATALVLVAAMGCVSTPDPSPGDPFGRVRPNDPGSPAEPRATLVPAPQGPTRDSQAHFIAQGIYLRGLDLLEQKDYDLAYLEFGRALDVYPDFYKSWHNRGLCQFEKQKYDNEIDCYRRCLEIQPDFMEALVSLGAAY